MKILVVEDSPTLRYTMCGFIHQAGHETLVAESGEQALQLVETTGVDLVIMDVEMPGLDGFETTRLIREFFDQRWVPIIFVTGMGDELSYQKGIEAGGDDYMIKPVSPVILQAKLRAFERIMEMQQQLQQLNDELEKLSQRDGLTQLFNRRVYEEKAHQQWQITARAHHSIAILMIDVDHFKEFNDSYGHQTGDDCLKQVARALSQALHRPADILARYGGEEFIALLPDTNLQGARRVAKSLRRAVQSLGIPHAGSSAASVVTVSIGGAVTDHTGGISEQDLAREADSALYRAKARGRNCEEITQCLPHKTVVILETTGDSLQSASTLLRERFNIITATTARECLEIVLACHPDLVILGGSTNKRDEEIIRGRLQARSQTRGIPVLQVGHTGDSRATNKSGLLAELEDYFN